MAFRYHYTGTEGKHLPEQQLTVIGGDAKAVYETEVEINHPEFKLLSKDVKASTPEPIEKKKEKDTPAGEVPAEPTDGENI